MTETEQAWDGLAKVLKTIPIVDGQAGSPNGAPSLPQELHVDASTRTEDALWQRLTSIAIHLDHATKLHNGSSVLATWTGLADASRDVPLLRSLYGLRRRASASDQEAQIEEGAEPDCLLEGARRLLDPSKGDLASGLRKQALRLVANCCADDDANRALIISRNGIEYMMLLAAMKTELPVLLPTLYNVCVDFDELAAGPEGKPMKTSKEIYQPGVQPSEETLTVAEQDLGKFNEKLDKTSIEIFLSLTPEVEPEYHSVLADVIEIASKPALFGLENILATVHSSKLDSKLHSMFTALTTHSHSYTHDDSALESICQTYLNVLAQPAAQAFLSQSSDDLQAFIGLPNLDDRFAGESSRFKNSFLDFTYILSTLPTYAEKHPPKSNLIHDLVKMIEPNHKLLAPSLVLINNSLTTVDRTARFYELYRLEARLVELLQVSSDSSVILPTLSICSRLTITPEGQTSLFSADSFSAINHILTNKPQRENNLEIHRKALLLVRLIIKSQQPHATALLKTQASLFEAILTLASNTIDATSKLEAGRITVEILRTALSSSSRPSQASTTPFPPSGASASPSAKATLLPSEAQTLLSSSAAINSIIYLITDAPSPAIRTEGLFGLGLLSTLISSTPTLKESESNANVHENIFSSLQVSKDKLLPIFEEIVSSSTSTDTTAGEEEGVRKAETENLKFLVSQLLISHGGARPQVQHGPSIDGRSDDTSTSDAAKTQVREELRQLAGKMGLAVLT